MKKKAFGSWLTAAPVCFQAPRTAPATSVAVVCGVVEVWASKGWHNPRGGSRGHGENSFCSGDLCGGGGGGSA